MLDRLAPIGRALRRMSLIGKAEGGDTGPALKNSSLNPIIDLYVDAFFIHPLASMSPLDTSSVRSLSLLKSLC
jgi:hypothetical protein